MISDETMMTAAGRMQEAADRAQAAADRMEAAAHRIALLLEEGYGGNGLRLIEALESATVVSPHPFLVWMQDVTSLLCTQPFVPHAHKESLVKSLNRSVRCAGGAEKGCDCDARKNP